MLRKFHKIEVKTDEQCAQSLELQSASAIGDTASSPTWSGLVSAETEQTKPPPPFAIYAVIMEPLFELKPISQVTEQALDAILSAIADAGAAADKLGYSIEPDASIIIACVQRKLDETSRSIWLWQLDNKEPTLHEFAGFLTKRAKKVQSELAQLPVQSTLGVITQRAEPNAHGFFKAQNGSSKGAVAKKAKIVCPRCEGGHVLHHAYSFERQLYQLRWEL